MENNKQANAEKEVKPLSKPLRFWYGIGDCTFTLMTNVETFYFNNFLTNVAMFAPNVAMTISTVASIIDAALSWIYGAIINAVKPGKWGRYRSWMILVPWIVPFIYAFEFIRIGEKPGLSAVLITLAAVVSHVVWNLPYAANASLVAVAGKTPEQRQQLASSRATWNNLASVLFSYLGLPLATVFAGILGAKYQWGAVAFVLGMTMVVGYWVHFKVTDGYEEIEDLSSGKQSKTKASAGDMVRGLFQNPPLIVLIIADLPKWIVKFVVAAAAIYYFRDAANRIGLQVTYVLVSGIMGVVGSFLAGILVKKFSSRTMMIGSLLIMALLMFLAYLSYANPILVMILVSLAMCGYGVCYAAAPALYADTAVYAKWKTGKDNTGWIMGLQTVPLKVAVIIRSVVVNAVLIAVGYNAATYDFATASESVKQSLTIPFTLIPAIAVAVGGLLLLVGFRLTKEKVAEYQAEIDAREA